MGHKLVRFLSGSIEAYRSVHLIRFGERLLLGPAVDAGTAGVNQIWNMVLDTSLKNVEETGDIVFHIGVRILDRVPHPGLSR